MRDVVITYCYLYFSIYKAMEIFEQVKVSKGKEIYALSSEFKLY